MRCPSCEVLLDSLRVGEIELDECPQCLGMWFDRGELHAVLTSRMAVSRSQPSATATSQGALDQLGVCCRCGGLLLEQKSGEQSLAGCAKCGGFWVPAATFLALRAKRPSSESGPGGHRPVPAGEILGRCAACDTPMRAEERQGQGFHRCSRCGGLFLARGALTFILAHVHGPFDPGPEPREGVREHAGCPACRRVLEPISWQGKPVRVWACTQCWGTFVPAAAMNQLKNPRREQQPGFGGVGGGLWKMLDAMVEWLVNPPKSPG